MGSDYLHNRAVRRARFRAPRAIGREKTAESRKKEETTEKLKAPQCPPESPKTGPREPKKRTHSAEEHVRSLFTSFVVACSSKLHRIDDSTMITETDIR